MSITESAVPAGWPANPVLASCVDANGATTGNGTASFGTLARNVLSVPSLRMVAGADITCTFVNSLNGLSGVVFDDGGAPSGGANTGTPNDGLRNGAEAGVQGVSVILSNCAAITHASTNTDNNGGWTLNIPAGVAAGTPVCVRAAVPATGMATGAHAVSGGSATPVPSGTPTTVGGVTHTYDRATQQIRLAAPASGTVILGFGQVPRSVFGAPGTRQAAVNTPAIYAHTFLAGTGGSVVFGITGEVATAGNGATPATWSGTIHTDPGCTGTLQGGATQLHPGGVATTVVQGQTVCVILREMVPANAENGSVNQTTVQARLGLTNAIPNPPGLSASHTLVDSTTVGHSALSLLKEVRNVTTGGAWGADNRARSGDVLAYRVTFTNQAATPMTKVEITDTVPAYTTFQAATAGASPLGLGNCTMNTPANPAPAPAVSCTTPQPPGGTGTLRWMFDGTFLPQTTGTVGFTVRVN